MQLLKSAGLNVEGNETFSSKYFCNGKFVSVHTTTNHQCIVTLNEMLSLYQACK